ncbi:MAG: helix-turn-helix transcriptional regulator [Alphaproteobacteria bacterium]|nr:helix-turn-helix transcriptional regulator [Alphaproteobacteria bacterium]
MTRKHSYPPNFIKQLREERNWTLRDLEERTGWSNQTLSNLELSKADLTWTKIQKLAEVFEVHPMEITLGPQLVAPMDDRERELINMYRGLEEPAKRLFESLTENINKKSQADTAEKKPVIKGK